MTFSVREDPFGTVDPFGADSLFADEVLPQVAQWTEPRAWRRPAPPAPGDIRTLLAEASLETRPVAKPQVPVLSSTGGWSWPVFTLPVGDLILTEVAVEYRSGVAYQVYAVDDGSVDSVLVGFFGLHVDALREINVWRRFVAAGGSLAQWVADHPDGVRVK